MATRPPLADPGASARLVSSLLRVRSSVVVRAGAPERRGRPRRPIWLAGRSLAVLAGLAACAVDPGDDAVEAPRMERANGVDDDGDGEIDEPVNFTEADVHWDRVTSMAGDRPAWADPAPDLVPLSGWGIMLVPPLGLLRDRTEEDNVILWTDWSGGSGAFGYTADLDGDGIAELNTVGLTSYEGDSMVQAWSGASLRTDVPLGEPDFWCEGAANPGIARFTTMLNLGPLSGEGSNIACGFEELGGWRVPIYPPEAFADGFASTEEADRVLHLEVDESIGSARTDFDGDGVPDFLTWRTHGPLGIVSGAEVTPGLYGAPDAILSWTTPEWWFCNVAGDVTGDGLPDLLAGDTWGETFSTIGDRTWLVDPRRGGGDLWGSAVSSFDLDVKSLQDDVQGLDDGDGDGHAEVLIGRSYIGAIVGTGVAYLLPGATMATPGRYGPEDAEVTFVADDQESTSEFGMGFYARDVLGDGGLSVLFLGPEDTVAVFFDLSRR